MKDKKCMYCSNDGNDDILIGYDKYEPLYIKVDNEKYLSIENDNNLLQFNINFCPMCGEELVKEIEDERI